MTRTRAIAVMFFAGVIQAATAQAQSLGQPRYEAGAYSSPAVSPYLMLTPQVTSNGGLVNASPYAYQAMIRPAIEARDEKNYRANLPGQSAASASGSHSRNGQVAGYNSSARPPGIARRS